MVIIKFPHEYCTDDQSFTSGWTQNECDNAIKYAGLIGADFSSVFSYPSYSQEDVIQAVRERWAQKSIEDSGGWFIQTEFLCELVKNNIIIRKEDEILLFKNDEIRRNVGNTV